MPQLRTHREPALAAALAGICLAGGRLAVQHYDHAAWQAPAWAIAAAAVVVACAVAVAWRRRPGGWPALALAGLVTALVLADQAAVVGLALAAVGIAMARRRRGGVGERGA